jgi:hypothetical protein
MFVYSVNKLEVINLFYSEKHCFTIFKLTVLAELAIGIIGSLGSLGSLSKLPK